MSRNGSATHKAELIQRACALSKELTCILRELEKGTDSEKVHCEFHEDRLARVVHHSKKGPTFYCFQCWGQGDLFWENGGGPVLCEAHEFSLVLDTVEALEPSEQVATSIKHIGELLLAHDDSIQTLVHDMTLEDRELVLRNHQTCKKIWTSHDFDPSRIWSYLMADDLASPEAIVDGLAQFMRRFGLLLKMRARPVAGGFVLNQPLSDVVDKYRGPKVRQPDRPREELLSDLLLIAEFSLAEMLDVTFPIEDRKPARDEDRADEAAEDVLERIFPRSRQMLAQMFKQTNN
jgi:hypothetical protein